MCKTKLYLAQALNVISLKKYISNKIPTTRAITSNTCVTYENTYYYI